MLTVLRSRSTGPTPKARPHSAQTVASAGGCAPHPGQGSASWDPHDEQNRESPGLAAPHWIQPMGIGRSL